MKKVLKVLALVLVFAAFAVVPVFAQGQTQELTPPNEPITLAEYPVLDMLVFAGVSWIVTEGLKSLSKLTKTPLIGKATAITGAVVYIIVALVDSFFGAIPPEFQDTTRNVLTLVVGLLAMYGYAGKTKPSK